MTRPLTLADYAEVEAEGRARFYPGMVRRGELSPDEADHDWRCWRAITEFYRAPADHPPLAQWDLSWRALAAAADKALKRRELALADNKKPELAGPLTDRRDAVAAIAWRLERRARFFGGSTRSCRPMPPTRGATPKAKANERKAA
jgi:hypothetical protein